MKVERETIYQCPDCRMKVFGKWYTSHREYRHREEPYRDPEPVK